MCGKVYDIKFTKVAIKDYDLLDRAGLSRKRDELIDIVEQDPFQSPPPYKALKGDKKGAYSRRINKKHRFVYAVLPNADRARNENGELYEGVVKIITMWTHYERI